MVTKSIYFLKIYLYIFTNYRYSLKIVLCCSVECKCEGKHRGHRIVTLEESRDSIRANLERDIKALESESKILENAQASITSELNTLQETREHMKELIKQEFEKIREVLVIKENELITSIEERTECDDAITKTIVQAQKFLEKLGPILEGGKTLLEVWNFTDITPDIANNVFSIANTKNEIDKIRDDCEESICKNVIESEHFKKKIEDITDEVKNLKEVTIKRIPICGPRNLVSRDVKSFSVTLEWDKNKLDDKYFIALQKEGTVYDPSSLIECTKNEYTLSSLEAGVRYMLSVRAMRGDVISKWANPLVIKTSSFTLQNLLKRLKERSSDSRICIETFKLFRETLNTGNKQYLNYLLINLFVMLLLML